MSAQKKGAQSERYRLTAMLRDPLTQVKVAALSGKLIAEWRDKGPDARIVGDGVERQGAGVDEVHGASIGELPLALPSSLGTRSEKRD